MPTPTTSSAGNGGPERAPGELLTVSQVADHLRVSERTIHRLYRIGMLPQPRRIGRSLRWPVEQIADWIADGCPPQRNKRGVKP